LIVDRISLAQNHTHNKNIMYFFFPTLNFVQNYYQIYPFLDQKCETRNSGYEISMNTDFRNHIIKWMAMLPWDVERYAEDLYTRFGDNIITDVCIKYYPTY
jgi:hypothetical protein